MKKSALLIALVFSFLFSQANTFIVTSVSDNGTGSLREAITLANANGATIIDTILFNISDITIAGRRITLTSELPALTSNIIIDASTQPGAKFGISDAKVELYFMYAAGSEVRAIKIYNCNNIGIYSLKITDNITWTQWYKETICIRMENSTNIQIGDVGKGNVIINWIHAIQGFGNVDTPNQYAYNKNINIYSNFFNLDDDGETAIGDGDLLVFIYVENINIGNLDPRTGNTLAATRKRIRLTGPKGTLLIANNKIGTNYMGSKMLSQPFGENSQLFDNIYIANGTPYYYDYTIGYNTDVKIINNLITGYCTAGINIAGIGKKFFIQGNKIGTDITGTKHLGGSMEYGIWVNNCRSAIIGVENDEEKERNIIAFGKVNWWGAAWYSHGMGILIYSQGGITVSRNSIFCNDVGSIRHAQGTAYAIPVVTINNVTSNSVSGTAPPLSKIEMFRDDTCANCEIKTYFDVTYADANGKWSKNNFSTDGLVVTATDTAGMTSEESAPRVQLKNFKVGDATCGQKNGSITGIYITSGTWWQWEDDKGNVVSKDTMLKNVGPGSYRLVVGIGANSCSYKTELWNIRDISMPLNLAPSITPASCGRNNGAISVNYDIYMYDAKWFNEANQLIGTGRYLQSTLPGNYTLQLTVLNDPSCNKIYGPFTLPNQSGPALSTASIQLNASTCGNNNGSIKGITAINATGGIFIQWLDSANKVVGNSYDLLNIYPGKYRMKFKDASACDTIVTPYLVVPAQGVITIDSSLMKIQPAKCTGEGGSITNLLITGAETYQWKELSSGAIFSTGINITNVPAGAYQLTVANNLGCTRTSSFITVPQATFKGVGISSFISKLAYCGRPNGSLEPQSFTGDTSYYTFRWVDSATNQTISTNTKVFGIYASTYMLYEKDSNGCEQLIFKTVLRDAPIPAFDYSNMQIKADNCLSGKGSISGVSVMNLVNGSTHYEWLDNANNSVASTPAPSNLAAGDYRLKVTDAMGCVIVSKPLTVDNVNVPLAGPVCDDQVIIRNTSATLTVKNKQAGTYQLFEDTTALPVQTNATGVFVTGALSTDRIYFIHHLSGVCQSSFIAVNVKVVDNVIVYVPSAFTPNGDSKNDLLKAIPYGKIKLVQFHVYNRWGTPVFSSSDFNKGWDGKINGTPVDSGVYIWMIKAIDEINKKFIEQKGTVMLIR